MPTHIAIPRRTLVTSFVLLVLAAIAGIAYVRLPQATIIVHPATYERTVTQEITLSTATQEPDFVRYVLPAKFISKEVTETKSFVRQGTKTFDDFSRGVVTMMNKQPEEQRLLPKTHLRHEASGTFFLTDGPVIIPPEDEVTVGVTAKEKGVSGNVPAGKFLVDKLPESFRDVVYAQSTTNFTGGISVETPLSEAEITQAKSEVKKQAEQKALAQLSTDAGGAGINAKLVSIEVPEEHVSAEPGSKAMEFMVRTKVIAQGFFPDNTDLLSLALLALRSSPKPDEEFVSYQPDSFALEIIRSDFTRGEARVTGSLKGTFAQKAGPNVYSIDNLAGRNQQEVVEYFQQFPSVGSVEVQLSPFWVRTVPSRTDAVEIVVKSESK